MYTPSPPAGTPPRQCILGYGQQAGILLECNLVDLCYETICQSVWYRYIDFLQILTNVTNMRSVRRAVPTRGEDTTAPATITTTRPTTPIETSSVFPRVRFQCSQSSVFKVSRYDGCRASYFPYFYHHVPFSYFFGERSNFSNLFSK